MVFARIIKPTLPVGDSVSYWVTVRFTMAAKTSWKPITPLIFGAESMLPLACNTSTIRATTATAGRYSCPRFACILNFEGAENFSALFLRDKNETSWQRDESLLTK